MADQKKQDLMNAEAAEATPTPGSADDEMRIDENTILGQWRAKAYDKDEDKNKLSAFWSDYFLTEKEIYSKLLEKPDEPVSGSVKDLAAKFDIPLEKMVGFLDGINDSLITKNPIETMTEDTEVSLAFDKELLYKNMSAREAQALADEAGLDLVKISPKVVPPVCKIMDYGKFRYEQARKDKDARKKQKIVEIKEVRMSPNIDTNDLNTKVSAARKFIAKGNKVKVSIRFRGREMAHTNDARPMMDDFAEKLSDIAIVDKPPKMEGRFMTMFLTGKK